VLWLGVARGSERHDAHNEQESQRGAQAARPAHPNPGNHCGFSFRAQVGTESWKRKTPVLCDNLESFANAGY
jgi:hypothetical protein